MAFTCALSMAERCTAPRRGRKRRAPRPSRPAHARGKSVRVTQPAARTKEVIVMRDVVKRFGAHEVLRGVSITVNRGETAVVIGGSGAGKTTLLRILIGLEKATSGAVIVDGHDITPFGTVELNTFRRKFG